MRRRDFINNSAKAMGLLPLVNIPQFLLNDPSYTKLTILHTNDVHSRIEPFPMDGSRNEGLGGAARRSALIKKIRSQENNVLLFDSGDIFQGTPYFNYFNGELEFKLMNKMKYDAATIGNHDFDLGTQNLADQLKIASFEMINSNYIVKDTPLAQKVKPYKIYTVEDIKIGVFGLGIELDGLVPKSMYDNVVYQDPIKVANNMADMLKNELKCDAVICLSHLGFKYEDPTYISDMLIASNTDNIDVILGGHTHTFLRSAQQSRNRKGKITLINQAGWAGILLGRLDLVFERNKKTKCISCKNVYLTNKIDNL